MHARTIRPLYDWQRHHPLAARIASMVPQELAVLRFSTLRDDIRARFGVSRSTASIAARAVRAGRATA
jgi:hypothetical protein